MSQQDQSFKRDNYDKSFIKTGHFFCLALVFLASGAVANNHLFLPGQPWTACIVEISDHSGIMPTSKNAVYRVQNPVTLNGEPPFLDLYSPDMAKLQNCLNTVTAVQGQTPFSVQLKASEYTLANINQFFFLWISVDRFQVQAHPIQRRCRATHQCLAPELLRCKIDQVIKEWSLALKIRWLNLVKWCRGIIHKCSSQEDSRSYTTTVTP